MRQSVFPFYLFDNLSDMYAPKLVFDGSAYGTSLGASAARNAGISVDYVLSISLRNSRYGTILSASAARNASIGNFVSHSKLTSVLNYLYCITLFRFCI